MQNGSISPSDLISLGSAAYQVNTFPNTVETLLAILLIWGAIPASSSPSATRPGHVVVVHHPEATETYTPRADTVGRMMARGLTSLRQDRNWWQARVRPGETIGIRIHSAPGRTGGTRPEVVEALVERLLEDGQAPSGIVVWDRHLRSLRQAGYLDWEQRYGIRVAGARESGYDENIWYESSLIGTLTWGDLEFGSEGESIGRRSHVTRLLTEEIDHIINVSPLLHHNLAGVNGSLMGLALASVDNTLRFRSDGTSLAVAVPEIIAMPEIGDRILLNVTDALLAQYQGQERTRLQDTVVLNELRLSTDPLALDVLSLLDLTRLREAHGILPAMVPRNLYRNAALLQLGIGDPDRILLERLDEPGSSP